MKKMLIFLLLAGLITAVSIPVFAVGAQVGVSFTINGVPYETPEGEPEPYINVDDRTMVPIRFFANGLGVANEDISWNESSETATLTQGDLSVSITVGQANISVNGEAVEMDTMAELKGGRTFIPVRFVAESLGATMRWDGTTRTVYVDTVPALTVAQMVELAAGLGMELDSTGLNQDAALTRLNVSLLLAGALAEDAAYDAYLDAFSGLYNGDLPFTDYRDFEDKHLPELALVFGTDLYVKDEQRALFGQQKSVSEEEAVELLAKFQTVKAQEPSEYQYLNELKEVAETGTNATTVSDLEPQIDLSKEKAIIEHPNFTAKLKRYYVLPMKSDVASLFESKLIGNREEAELDPEAEAIIVSVVDITFKKDGGLLIYSDYIYTNPSIVFLYQLPRKTFGYKQGFMHEGYTAVKGTTEEVMLYGKYENDDAYVFLSANEALNKGSHALLYHPNRENTP